MINWDHFSLEHLIGTTHVSPVITEKFPPFPRFKFCTYAILDLYVSTQLYSGRCAYEFLLNIVQHNRNTADSDQQR